MVIRCAHGDTALYPLAQVHLEINGHHIDVEAALSDTLPMPVLLGTDVPQLQDFVGHALFGDNQQLVAVDVLAVTRAQLLRQNEHDAVLDQQDKFSGVVPMALDYGDPEVSDVEDDDTSEITIQAETSTMNGDRPRITEGDAKHMDE